MGGITDFLYYTIGYTCSSFITGYIMQFRSVSNILGVQLIAKGDHIEAFERFGHILRT